MGGLEAVGHDIAREGGQDIVALGVGGDGGHAAEGAQGPGNLGILAGGGGRVRRRGGHAGGRPAGALEDLQGAQGGGPVALQEGQLGQAPRHGRALAAVGRLIQRGEEFAIGFGGARIGVAIEELGVFG